MISSVFQPGHRIPASCTCGRIHTSSPGAPRNPNAAPSGTVVRPCGRRWSATSAGSRHTIRPTAVPSLTSVRSSPSMRRAPTSMCPSSRTTRPSAVACCTLGPGGRAGRAGSATAVSGASSGSGTGRATVVSGVDRGDGGSASGGRTDHGACGFGTAASRALAPGGPTSAPATTSSSSTIVRMMPTPSAVREFSTQLASGPRCPMSLARPTPPRRDSSMA